MSVNLNVGRASPASGKRSRRVIVLAVTLSLILAGGLGVWFYIGTLHPKVVPKADGPTFYQAIGAVNGSVANQAGGPWTLYAVWGIAAPIPFAPNALGWFTSNNGTVNSCGAQFNGLTLWNGSIPLFNGSFDSGTAPFWQFAYFSNASQSILIATNVLGVAHVYPPMGMSSTCARSASLSAGPWVWARILSPFPSNSPAMALSAWNAGGEGWMTTNRPAYEVYVLGWSYWGSANPGGLIVKLARCGEVGFTGVQPDAFAAINRDGQLISYFYGTQGCGDVISLGPPPVYAPYGIAFSSPSPSLRASTITVNVSFQVTTGNKSTFLDTDINGLVTWMTTLNFSNTVGQQLPSAIPKCSSWVPSLTYCDADGSGWYAVLLSSSGAWLDSYPSSLSGIQWEIPDVSLVSNQCLVLVVPSSWNVTGGTLSVNGTVPFIGVSGSISI